MPSAGEQINKQCYIRTMEYCSVAEKNNHVHATCNKMDGSQTYYVDQKKSDAKGHILNDFIYMSC